MNSIVRIILRGLLSGEIKPEPQVFACLRELSERQLQRHSRILRLARPPAAGVRLPDPVSPEDPPTGMTPLTSKRPLEEPSSSDTISLSRAWSTFASVSCGRWIRVAACLLVTSLVLGVADARAMGLNELEGAARATALIVPIEAGTEAFAQGAAAAVVGVLSNAKPSSHAMFLLAMALLAVGLLVAGWDYYCRNRLLVMRPYETALLELESAAYRASRGEDQDHQQAVVEILHDYIQAQLKLPMAGMDRDAFLNTLTKKGAPLTGYQQLLLRDVLDDLTDAPVTSSRQHAELAEKASRFVWATSCYRPIKSGRRQILVGAG